MKVFNLFMATQVIGMLMSCGSGDNKQSPTPVIVQAPGQSAPTTPTQTAATIPVTQPVQPTEPSSTTATTVETPVTQTTSTDESAPTDQELAAYYDGQYVQQNQSQYDPQSPYFFQEVDQLANVVNQPYGNQVDLGEYQAPYLGSRYSQHREFLNYGAAFSRVRTGSGGWNQDNYRQVRHNFKRSIDWINQIPQDANRTLDHLGKCGFHSRDNLEGRLHDAVEKRDHRSIVTVHDQLLDEYQKSNNRSANDRHHR